MGKLTNLKINAIKSAGKYVDGNGLMLVVKPSLAKSWILRVQSHGARYDIGLGSFGELSLTEAREKAVETRKLVRAGATPETLRSRSTSPSGPIRTFRDAAIAAHAEFNPSWVNSKHQDQWIDTLNVYAFPQLGDLNVEEIEAPEIIRVLRPIWLTKEETARRVRQRICAVLDWAHAHGLRSHESPRSSIAKGLPRQKRSVKHHASMEYAHVADFFAYLRKTNSVSSLALQFLILNASRSGEVRGALWQEIDIAKRTWKIPAARMKAGVDHVVPLSTEAVAILEEARLLQSKRKNAVVFPNHDGLALSDSAIRKIVKSFDPTLTVHGFRSTFRVWAAEQTMVRSAAIEAALAHTNQNRVEAAYLRTTFLTERVSLMQSWSDHLLSKV